MGKKLLLIMLAAILFLGGCNEKNLYTYEFSPQYGEIKDIDSFFAQFFAKNMQMDPETATWMGEYDGCQEDRQDDKLTDISFTFREKELDFYKNSLAVLLSFDETCLDPEQKLNKDILAWFLNSKIEGEAFLHYEYLVNPTGIAASLPSTLVNDHKINSLADAENCITRLKAFPWKLSQLTDGIAKQMDMGIVPPGRTFSGMSQVISQFIAPEPSQNTLYTTFVAKLQECAAISEEDKITLKAEALAAMEDCVYKAYWDLHKVIIQYSRDPHKASVNAGIWELPQGDEYYAYLVRKYTTTDLTPQEIHDLGVREVERIHREIREVMAGMGYQDQDPVRFLERIDNKNLIRDRDDILAAYRTAVEDAYQLLPELFNTLPQGPVYVESVPSHRETTYTNHYSLPSPDGSIPGVFHVNLSYPHAKNDIKALAFHETVPGHHLQITIQMESDLTLFRSLTGTTAYAEGWALYAEKLMYENEFYGDPISELGYLQSELFRAARLVIDTGIHYKKWTREEALSYLRETTGLNWDTEIDRYIAWPGQALAYKVGELKILELRALAMEQLGADFDLKEFHDVVLLTGSAPLEILEQEVIRYIEEKK